MLSKLLTKFSFNIPAVLLGGVLFSNVNVVSAQGCDACVQGIVNSATSQMQTGLNQVISSAQAAEQAMGSLSNTVDSVNTSLETVLDFNLREMLSAIDASSKAVSLSVEANTATMVSTNDALVAALNEGFKNMLTAENDQRTYLTYDTVIAQPVAGDIGANRAVYLKEGVVVIGQEREAVLKEFREWNRSSSAAGTKNLKRFLVSANDDSVFDPSELMGNRSINVNDSLDAQKLLSILVNPFPNPQPMEDVARMKHEINNTHLEYAHSVLVDNLLMPNRAVIPLSTDTWGQGYVNVSPNPDGNVSLNQFIESETMGPLISEKWYEEKKINTNAGLLREMVYSQKMENYLLLRQLKLAEQALTMDIIDNINAISKER